MKLTNTFCLVLVFGTLLFYQAKAQEDLGDLYDLSLEDLMNIPIESASKKSENLFDAPVSSYSITRDEIVKSGATSIPEALRLCPGIIVREISNGNYDIHIRGFENLSRSTSSFNQINLISLVMIDNRPIFSYNQGGIFWENLPIDLVDVERIEIVRGPTAPLFGPNAVSGVINIITRQPQNEGFYTSANVQGGLPNTLTGNLAIGQKFNENFDLTLSANYQRRERHDELYYMFESDQFIENITTLPDADIQFPEPELSLEKWGVNAFMNYQFNSNASIALSTGLQQSEAQKMYLNSDITALSFSGTKSKYVNLAGDIYGAGIKISHNSGFDNMSYGIISITPKYDYNVTDIVVDYEWNVTDKLSFRPGINYQRATYDDTDYLDESIFGGYLNAAQTITSIAASMKGDYLITDNWRLIAALRADKFNAPDDVYLSYQFASTYKLNDKYLFRAVHARSNSSAFIGNAFLKVEIALPGTTSNVYGNPELELTNNTLSEIGFRGQLSTKFQVDMAIFSQRIENLSMLITESVVPQPDNSITVTQRFSNLPLQGIQNGITLSANYVPTNQLQLKPFITVQKSKVHDLPVNPLVSLDDVIEEDDHKSTPTLYGGAFINYIANRKLNLNLNAYYFSSHTLYHAMDLERASTVGNIDGKLLLNSKITFHAIDKLNFYLNVRNIIGNDSREHYGTDRIGRSYYLGASYNF